MSPQTFLRTVRKNPINSEIMDRMPELNIPDCWLVAGSLFQTVWNDLTKRPHDFGIKDYDVFYFDNSDLSWEAEDRVVQKVQKHFHDLDAHIEIRNQARVHLWYPEKFKIPYPKLSKATDGIDRFLAKACQVGIHVSQNTNYEVYSPNGFEDLIQMKIRKNPSDNFKTQPFMEKADKWKSKWPELTVVV